MTTSPQQQRLSFFRRACAFGMVAGLLALGAGCGRSADDTPTGSAASTTPAAGGSARPAETGDILVGHYGSLTGSEATFGQSTSRGIRLAIKELNDAGGFNGRRVALKEYDTKGDAKEATLAVTRLVKSDRVIAVLGEVASGLSLAGGPVCQEARVPMISPSSTNPRVTEVGDMIFRVCFIDPFQGFVCAKFAAENLGAKTAALLYDQKAPYSVGLATEFKQAFMSLGGTIVAEQTYTGGDQDFTAQITTIRGSKPDVLFIPGYYTDVGNISIQARKLGLNATLLGGDGWDSEQLPKIAGRAIEGAYYSNHYAPDQPEARVQEFIRKYKAQYDGQVPDGLAALGYDAANILIDAMQRSGSLDGEALAKALASTAEFPGVTGTITIDPQRNARKAAVIVQIAGEPLGPKYRATIEP